MKKKKGKKGRRYVVQTIIMVFFLTAASQTHATTPDSANISPSTEQSNPDHELDISGDGFPDLFIYEHAILLDTYDDALKFFKENFSKSIIMPSECNVVYDPVYIVKYGESYKVYTLRLRCGEVYTSGYAQMTLSEKNILQAVLVNFGSSEDNVIKPKHSKNDIESLFAKKDLIIYPVYDVGTTNITWNIHQDGILISSMNDFTNEIIDPRKITHEFSLYGYGNYPGAETSLLWSYPPHSYTNCYNYSPPGCCTLNQHNAIDDVSDNLPLIIQKFIDYDGWYNDNNNMNVYVAINASDMDQCGGCSENALGCTSQTGQMMCLRNEFALTDIIAHEYTHPWSQSKVQYFYCDDNYECWGVKEHISDFFGVVWEKEIKGWSTPDWILAENTGYAYTMTSTQTCPVGAFPGSGTRRVLGGYAVNVSDNDDRIPLAGLKAIYKDALNIYFTPNSVAATNAYNFHISLYSACMEFYKICLPYPPYTCSYVYSIQMCSELADEASYRDIRQNGSCTY